MATIKQIASRAGVSVGTVSNVLNGSSTVSREIRDRVQAVMRSLDYHPNFNARSLKARHTKLIGMVVSDITNPFFPQMIRGAEDIASRHGFLLVVVNTDDEVNKERQALSVLRSRQVDGIAIVLASHRKAEFTHIRQARQSGMHVVCLDRIPPAEEIDSVTVNNVEGALDCVRHLIAVGHRRIAILTGGLDIQTGRDRLRGYEQALKEARIKPDPALVRNGDFRFDLAYRASLELLITQPRPTAVFSCNGTMAFGLMRAIDELGLQSPRDVAVATFDDLPIYDAFRPHLTSVVQPAYEIGKRGVELLIQRITGKLDSPKPISIRLPLKLAIRESSLGTALGAEPTSARRLSRQ
ncbi:MAG TPA: LacI family DNA-binding transcriptional regulator [Bryobacteraceae bacterium]|jgi:LacI family transcriptional regulator